MSKSLSRIIRLIALVMAGLMLMTAICPALAAGNTVYAAQDNAVVYDKNGNAIGALPANTKLTLTGVRGNICRVELNGRTGYMDKAALSSAAASAGTTQSGTTEQTTAAWVSREGAAVCDRTGSTTATLALNTQVLVTAVRGNICQVSVSGQMGYMMKSDLSRQPV